MKSVLISMTATAVLLAGAIMAEAQYGARAQEKQEKAAPGQEGAPAQKERSGKAEEKGEKPKGEKAAEDKPKGEKGKEEKSADQPKDKAKAKDDKAADKPKDDKAAADKSKDDKAAADKAKDDKSAADKARDDKRPDDKAKAEKPADKAREDKTAAPADKDVKDVRLKKEEKTKIRQVFTKEKVKETTNVNFNIVVGTAVPTHVTLYDLPATVIEVVPSYRGYKYVVVEDEIVIVEPSSHKIVAVLPGSC